MKCIPEVQPCPVSGGELTWLQWEPLNYGYFRTGPEAQPARLIEQFSFWEHDLALVRLPDGLDGRETACSAGDPQEKEMATHCSILAWRILRTEEPGGLQSIGMQRVRHD